MLSNCWKYKKNTESKNPEVSRTNNGKILQLHKCAVYDKVQNDKIKSPNSLRWTNLWIVTSHIPNIPHPNMPNISHPEHPTSLTSYIPNIPHAEHPTFPISHIPNIPHPQHHTSPTYNIPNIPHNSNFIMVFNKFPNTCEGAFKYSFNNNRI